MQLLFETIIDHIANFTATSQTFEMVKVRRISSLINNNLIEKNLVQSNLDYPYFSIIQTFSLVPIFSWMLIK